MQIHDHGAPSSQIEQFLLDLSEVSYRHGLAVGSEGVVFVMEGEDYSMRYRLSCDDGLLFSS